MRPFVFLAKSTRTVPALANEQYARSTSGNYSCVRFTKDNSTRPIGWKRTYAVLNTLASDFRASCTLRS